MRVTLSDRGHLTFDDQYVGTLDAYMSINDYEKLQAYIAAANEAFDALQSFRDNYDSGRLTDTFPFYVLCGDILREVGD